MNYRFAKALASLRPKKHSHFQPLPQATVNSLPILKMAVATRMPTVKPPQQLAQNHLDEQSRCDGTIRPSHRTISNVDWEPTRYAPPPSSSLDDTFRTIPWPPEVAFTVVP
eukprot:6199547-Pleurochrysis_carterae.AAC.1